MRFYLTLLCYHLLPILGMLYTPASAEPHVDMRNEKWEKGRESERQEEKRQGQKAREGNKMVIALMLLCLHVESEVVGEPSMQLFWSVHKHLPWHGSFSFSTESGTETGLRQHYLRGTDTHTHKGFREGGLARRRKKINKAVKMKE